MRFGPFADEAVAVTLLTQLAHLVRQSDAADLRLHGAQEHRKVRPSGWVAEWSIAHAWKACLPQGNAGSNPAPSALFYVGFSKNAAARDIGVTSLTAKPLLRIGSHHRARRLTAASAARTARVHSGG